jgi:DNA-binding CsgD family transcriptional regulator
VTTVENSVRGVEERLVPPLLTALEAVLDAGSGDEQADGPGWVVCHVASALVDATVAAHVRYDPAERTCRLCLWRSRPPDPLLVAYRIDLIPGSATRDWWTRTRTRQRLFAWMDQPHLVELPLTTGCDAQSLIVLGRSAPFTESDSMLLAAGHRALRLIERVLDMWAQRTGAPVGLSSPYRSPLTARELEVLQMLSEGLLARSIAHRLDLSERTVHKHLGSLYRKLDAHDRLLAVRRAETLGLIPAPRSGPVDHRNPPGARRAAKPRRGQSSHAADLAAVGADVEAP